MQFTADNPLNGECGKANVEPQLKIVNRAYEIAGAGNALQVCWPSQEIGEAEEQIIEFLKSCV